MFEALSSIVAFLGGSAFRMIWGEISAHLTAKREHAFEIERMKLAEDLEASKHERQKDMVTLQHSQGVELVRVQSEAAVQQLDAQIFQVSQERGMTATGIWLVDFWNASIRPAAATLALWLWLRHLYVAQWSMAGRDWDMVCAILGWFFADRSMGKRGR